jgi:integrase
VHGLRSTFRDWTAEQTDSANEVAEACLAHATGDAVQLAYKRTDFFDKRRELMAAWAGYLTA